MSERRGVSLAVDVGTVRVGVAACDADGILAFPLCTVKVEGDPTAGIGELAGLVAQHDARDVYVGNPLHLSGKAGASAAMAQRFAEALARVLAPLPVYLVDERYSSVAAGNLLHEAGRSAKAQRAIVDQAAAQLVLQHVLDAQAGSPHPPAFAARVVASDAERNGVTPREPTV